MIISGCTNTTTSFNNSKKQEHNEKKQQVDEEEIFQFAGPWDKDLFDSFYLKTKEVSDIGEIKGGIVPHHLLAGYIDATFFEYIKKQKPSTILLIGPNHFSRGFGVPVITSKRNWKTPYGITKANTKIIDELATLNEVVIDENVIKEEHSMYSIIPFINKSLPDTSVVPLIFNHNITEEESNKVIQKIIEVLPKDAVIVSSIDFSHYQTLPAANFHDELSINVIKTFDYSRLDRLEIDSIPSLEILLKLMEYYKTQHVAYEIHDNSALIANNENAQNNTSYYSPYFATGKPETNSAISILQFGDLMLDRDVQKQITAHGEEYLLEKLAGQENRFFSGTDIIAANLEGPFADSRRNTSKSIAFRFDPTLIPMLQTYKFNLFNTANNHSIDMSRKGLEESNNNVDKAGIAYYGGDGYTVTPSSSLTKTIGNKTITFIGVNDTFHTMDEDEVEKLIKKGKEISDYVIVNIHWGTEYKPTSNARQQYLAHLFIDNGADIIIGHHPHVIQEMEIYNNKPIFYSLGNFIFDQYWSTPTQVGLGVGLVLYKDQISTYLFPLQGTQSQLIQIIGTEKDQFFANFIDKSNLNNHTITNNNINIFHYE